MTAEVDALIAVGLRLRVPDVAIIELVYVLEGFYLLTREEIAQAVDGLIGQSVFDLNRSLWTTVMRVFVEHPKLSCADIYLTFDARQYGADPLASFDKKLVSQLGAVRPAELSASR